MLDPQVSNTVSSPPSASRGQPCPGRGSRLLVGAVFRFPLALQSDSSQQFTLATGPCLVGPKLLWDTLAISASPWGRSQHHPSEQWLDHLGDQDFSPKCVNICYLWLDHLGGAQRFLAWPRGRKGLGSFLPAASLCPCCKVVPPSPSLVKKQFRSQKDDSDWHTLHTKWWLLLFCPSLSQSWGCPSSLGIPH